jgi:hypothetical protein
VVGHFHCLIEGNEKEIQDAKERDEIKWNAHKQWRWWDEDDDVRSFYVK